MLAAGGVCFEREAHGGGGEGGSGGRRGGLAARPVCTAPLPHSLMQKRAQTSGVRTFSALVCFVLEAKACVFVQC